MITTHGVQLDLNLLAVFHWIYVEKSVSTAAKQLGISQSAVSHSLKKLRELFQDELFLRSGSSMEPTPKAQLIFQPISEIISKLNSEVLTSIVFDPATARRCFTLAMIDMSEVVFLPSIFRYFQRYAPGCTLVSHQVQNESMVSALETGLAEVVIGSVASAPDFIYQQTLFHHDYQVLVCEQHPRIRGDTLTWDDYRRESHIAVAAGTNRHLEDTTLQPRGIKRNVVLTLGGYLSVPWILPSTDLIATVPTRLADTLVQTAPVRKLPLPEAATPYALRSMWHPRWHNDPGHRWFRGVIFQLLSRYPEMF
ncbi:LysR family transcriptional regulator [Pseudomonas sp. NPDC096950]|uniref:LysR family transcriptional regulator n=1 Tax=Pseudomonas sp. NPDC096950 TaxID=3364485 RepID=UPI00383AF0A2